MAIQPNTPPPVETLYQEAEIYFASLIEAIDCAAFSVDLEVYIYESRQLGINISDALTRASSRGVRVRLLTDGVGIDHHFTELANSLAAHQVNVRIHKPLPWRLEHWRYAVNNYQGFRKLFFLLSSINQRNHRKTCIIDGKTMFLGSINISHNHLKPEHGGASWRDTAIKLERLDLEVAQTAFDLSWSNAKRSARRVCESEAKESPFLFNYSRKLRQHHDRVLLERINQAKTQILITNAYFVPETKLLLALRKAASRNVDIKILLPAHSDVWFMPWVSAFFYKVLLKAGVRIFEYLPGMLHAKTIVIDDWSTVGSSNLNHRSFRHDLEVDYVLQTNESKRQLEAGFDEDLKQSEEQKLEELGRRKGWRILAGAVILILLGNWL